MTTQELKTKLLEVFYCSNGAFHDSECCCTCKYAKNRHYSKTFLSSALSQMEKSARKECKELNFDHYIASKMEKLKSISYKQGKKAARNECKERHLKNE